MLLGIFYAIWIGSYALFTPDESRYSEVAREMVVTGDYITPRLNGVAFLDKPVLYYWLQASAIKLFGLKEWALRFWPAFIGVLGCLITYISGRILFDRRTGIISALLLATSPVYYGAAHYANLDLEVAVLIGSSLLFFMLSMKTMSSKLRSTFLITAYVFSGLAALTKGLIGIAFPVMIIGAWILLLNRWSILKKMHLILGILIFLAISAPWYMLAQKANPEFLHFFFVTQQVSRFLTTDSFNNQAPIWFYIPIILGGFFPWSIFIIQAITQKIKIVWQNPQQHDVTLFLLLWFFIVVSFFSIPKSKTIGYIIPAFPAMALLTGNYLSHLWDKPKAKGIYVASTVFIILCGIISAGFLIAPHIDALEIPRSFALYSNLISITFPMFGIAVYFLRQKKNLQGMFLSILLSGSVLLLTLMASVNIVNERSIKPLVTQMKPYLKPTDEVVTFYRYYQDLPIYLQRRITIVADWKAPDIVENDNWVRELWYGMRFQNTEQWLIDEHTFWQQWNSNKRLFVITDMRYYKKLETSAKNIYKLTEYHEVVLVSNKPITPQTQIYAR